MIEHQHNHNNNEINEFIHTTETTTTTSITLPSTTLIPQIASLTEFDSFESAMESFDHYSYHPSLSPSLSSVHSPLSPSPSSISLFFGGESSSSASSVFSSEEDNISHNQSFPANHPCIHPNLNLDQEEVNNQVFAELFKDLETSTNIILPTLAPAPTLPTNEQFYHEETTIFKQPPVLPIKPRGSGRRRSIITKDEPDNSSSDSHSVASHRGRKRRLTVSRREADDMATTSDSHNTSGCEGNTLSCMNNENDDTPLDEVEKKERNRKCAFLYRKKRKVYVQTLENQLSTLNAELHARDERMKAVEMENAVLKQQLTFFQGYLKSHMNDKSDNSQKSSENAVVPVKRSRKSQFTEVVTTNKPPSSTTTPTVSTVKRGRKSIFKSPMSTSLVMLAILSCFLFCTPWFSSDFSESSTPQYNSNFEHHDYTYSPEFASSFPSSEPSSSSSSYSIGGSSGRKGRVLLQIPGDGSEFDDFGMLITTSEVNIPEDDHIQFAYPLFTNNQDIQIEDISNQDLEKQHPQVKREPNYHEYESLSIPMLETPILYSLNSNSSEDVAW
jgi:hypothetical protein